MLCFIVSMVSSTVSTSFDIFFFPALKIISSPCTLSCPKNFLLRIYLRDIGSVFLPSSLITGTWHLYLSSKPKKANDAHLSLQFSSASTSILTSECQLYDQSPCVTPALGDSRHGSRTQGWGTVNEKRALPGCVMNSQYTHTVKCSDVEHEGKHQVSTFAFNSFWFWKCLMVGIQHK